MDFATGCFGATYSQASPNLTWYDDNERGTPLLNPTDLQNVFNRNTNCSKLHDQTFTNGERKTGSCYAHAACSAYLNTVSRIYGAKQAPSYAECFPIADYNKGEGGLCYESIRLLEDHFHFGVQYNVMRKMQCPSIRDVMVTSVVASFQTTDEGYQKIGEGKLLEKPQGKIDGGHETLVEAYDFENNYWICKNSWGYNEFDGRFKLRFEALHSFFCVQVFFTINSIQGKTLRKFIPRINNYRCNFKGKRVKCAMMDQTTACYCTEYVCQPSTDNDGHYFGIDIYDYINAMLVNKQESEDSVYYSVLKPKEAKKLA